MAAAEPAAGSRACERMSVRFEDLYLIASYNNTILG